LSQNALDQSAAAERPATDLDDNRRSIASNCYPMATTASDLLHLPHFLILRDDRRTIVRECADGHLAHDEAQRLMTTNEWDGEIIVCVRIRTLTPASYAFRHNGN